MRKSKTIVIGSGLAGLSAALELSHNGFEVLLLEAAPYIGGRTASWNKDGMEVESGLHRVLGLHGFSQTREKSRIEDERYYYLGR